MDEWVYVFNGRDSAFPSGVFSTYEKATAWIEGNKLTGLLSKYPLDSGVYEWAIKHQYFNPQQQYQTKPKFIQKFSSASMEHWHFEKGENQ